MRAIRTWGSVRGVPGDWHPYRDLCGDATRAPTQGPDQEEVDLRVAFLYRNWSATTWDGRMR